MDKNHIAHLKEQFESCKPILFTGAGFSCSAFNTQGGLVPTVDILRRKLWDICFPSDDFEEEASLQDLYHTALEQRKRNLADLLKKEFSVSAEKLPAWYERWFSQSWHAVYTINIDNLEMAAAARYDLPRNIVTASAVSDGEVPIRTSDKRNLLVPCPC